MVFTGRQERKFCTQRQLILFSKKLKLASYMFLCVPHHLSNKIYLTKILYAFFTSIICARYTVQVILLHLINPNVKFEGHTLRSLSLCIPFLLHLLKTLCA